MRVVYEYSHLGGSEILKVRYPILENEIYEVIASIKGEKLKVSLEKTKKGRLLYSPIHLNEQFRKAFNALDFRELRDHYLITLPNSRTVIPGAYKQVDYVKDKVLVEV